MLSFLAPLAFVIVVIIVLPALPPWSIDGSIPCRVADAQVKKLVSAIELGPRWLDEVLSIISLKDETE